MVLTALSVLLPSLALFALAARVASVAPAGQPMPSLRLGPEIDPAPLPDDRPVGRAASGRGWQSRVVTGLRAVETVLDGLEHAGTAEREVIALDGGRFVVRWR